MPLSFSIKHLIYLVYQASILAAGLTTLPAKRGLAYVENTYDPDNRLLVSKNSTVTWYYNWDTVPIEIIPEQVVYLPLIHGLANASHPGLRSQLNRLPPTSTHILTFNEPDGDKDSGGSDITPEEAARSYLQYIAPLRSGPGRTWNLSHPVVTGSVRGLNWLRSFNDSCFQLEPRSGCPADFVSLHWYGDLGGLASWIGQLHEFYGRRLKVWVTEMGIPSAPAEQNLRLMGESMPYLDGLEHVEGYAWFGAFRSHRANKWTGPGVSLFDEEGGLTDLGALYVGGKERGFARGMTGPQDPPPRGNPPVNGSNGGTGDSLSKAGGSYVNMASLVTATGIAMILGTT